MKRPSRRVLSVLAGVLALHFVVLLWWQQTRLVSGEGAWHASASHPFRVRATVLQEALPALRKPEVAPIPLRPTAGLVRDDRAPVAVPDQLMAPSSAGEKRPWAPLPSDYLTVEQVDAFPHPEDDWILDRSQVPLTQGAWLVTLRIWVSAAGRIDHVDMLDSDPHADWVNQLLTPLAQTPMVPAQLAGQAVPLTYVVQLAPDQLP